MEVFYQSLMVRCFPCGLDFGQSNNKFYGISAFLEQIFCLAPQWKINWPRWIYFSYISLLKSLNLVLILDAKLDGQQGTWTRCTKNNWFEMLKANKPYLPNTNINRLVRNMNESMNANVTSQKRGENWTERYLRKLQNQNGEHLVNLCDSSLLETKVYFQIFNQNFMSCWKYK